MLGSIGENNETAGLNTWLGKFMATLLMAIGNPGQQQKHCGSQTDISVQ
jgi:hypothetical protein